ncbi:MAG: TauD/TfdA family dioxygenase [Paracoccaceae bacterium]|nr:TauD/TfdA family dioxygenase [Paracoccaceae bacterium]
MAEAQPITGALGAVLPGLDLAKPDDATIASLKAALDEHLVIYVPDQDLDRFQLSALARHFGPPFLHPLVDNGYDDRKDVLELRREPEQTTMFGGASWHADITWLKPAGYVSILHAKILPPVGGDTGFASTIAAFDALSDGMKDMLWGLKAVHSYHWYERREDPDWRAVHPVVRRHPATGREGLYINRMFTNRFDGMTVNESRGLLAFLCNHIERHDFTCRFRWKPGGVILWDNRFTLHYPINDFSGQLRVMIRTSTMEA